MKAHEENKISVLLDYIGYTESECEKILDLIDNKNRSEDDMISLLENIKNCMED